MDRPLNLCGFSSETGPADLARIQAFYLAEILGHEMGGADSVREVLLRELTDEINGGPL